MRAAALVCYRKLGWGECFDIFTSKRLLERFLSLRSHKMPFLCLDRVTVLLFLKANENQLISLTGTVQLLSKNHLRQERFSKMDPPLFLD